MFKSTPRLFASLACTTILLSACVPALNGDTAKEKAAFTFPDIFSAEESSESGKGTTETKSSAYTDWQQFFMDSQLRELIETALSNNQELHVLEQEIALAKNEVSARRGEYLPKVGAGANYEREKVGENTSQGASDNALGLPSVLRNRQAGIFASWEMDIWHRLRDAKESAYYAYLASVEGKKFMVTHLVAEIADTYYELMALDQQLELVKRYVETLQQAQQVVEYQKEAARANSLAVNRFAAEVLKNRSLQYKLQREVTVTENKLNTLVGRFPQAIKRKSADFLTQTMPILHLGLPSQLLENRPDIQQSIFAMQVAELDVEVAKARFYPSLSLDAAVGFQGFNSKYFLNSPESLFYNTAANLTAPLINRLAIEADYQSANSKQFQAIYRYQQAVINAYVEVVNQLTTIKNMEKTYASKEGQVEALKKSIEVSNILFRAARIDYLESLLTQRDALEAQMELMEIKQRQLSAYINLYKALGGGWRDSKPDEASKQSPSLEAH